MMTRNRLLLSLCLAVALPSRTGLAAEPDVAALIQGLKENVARFKAQDKWWIEYDQSRELGTLPPGFDPNFPAFHWVNARWQAIELLHKKDLAPDGEDIWYLWKDGVTVMYDLSGNYAVYPAKGPEFFQAFYYTDTLLLDLYRDPDIVDPDIIKVMGVSSISDSVHKWSLPESLGNGEGYSIEADSDRATIDGDKCIVLRKGDEDTLWIDSAHGYTCRKRMFIRDGVPAYSLENQELYEVIPGLWLPRRQLRTFYNGANTDPSIRGTVRFTEVNTLRKADFETVRLSAFAVPQPRNCMVTDMVRDKSYFVGESGQGPDEIFKASVARAVRTGQRGAAPAASGSRSLFFSANVLLLAICLLAIAWKTRKRLLAK